MNTNFFSFFKCLDTLFNILIFLLLHFLKYILFEPPCVFNFSTLNICKPAFFVIFLSAVTEKT